MINPSPAARRLGSVALLVLAMVAATWIAGWWGIALVAAAWGWRGRAMDAGIAAFVAWVALLAFVGGSQGLMPFARRLGGIFSLPGWAMLVVTPLFSGLLAWGTAALLGSRRPSPVALRPKGS
jgi:hypothetical protein